MDTDGLSIICAGLGIAEEDENGNQKGYRKSDYCLDNLKDLQRFLRRDDPQRRDVFKQICKWNTVSRDLIPIIEQYHSDHNLVISAVKILVFLTMPIDTTSDDIAQQMEYLWALKAAMTRNLTTAIIVELLEDPLDHLEHDAFTEDDWKLVQLVLTLIRNILAIQGISLQQKASGSATQFLCLHDRFLELMFQENVTDLILVLTQHISSSGYLRQDNLLLLEIFHYVFLGQAPNFIARASRKGSEGDLDVTTSIDSLKSMMEEEKEKRRITRIKNLDRHSQFSGTFTRFSMDGSKTLFKGNPATAFGDGLLKVHRVQRGPLKKIAWDHESTSLPKGNILELLNNFLDQFLTGGYNDFVTTFQHEKLAVSEKPNMDTTSKASLDNDDNLSFCGDFCGPIEATMNEAMFCLVISKWREIFEGLKETNDYKSLSAAISLMKNMIRMLDLVLKILPEDTKEPQTARVLLYKIFYDQTDQGLTQFLLNLFRTFDNHKQPKSDLADLLEIIHIVLRLMEKLEARGSLRVSTKSRKSKKKKIQNVEEKVVAENLREHTDPHTADRTDENVMATESTEDKDLNKSFMDDLYESKFADKVIDKEVPSIPEARIFTDGLSHFDPNKTSNNLKAVASSIPQDSEQLGDDSSMGTKILQKNPIDLANETTDSSDNDQSPPLNEIDFNVSKLVAGFASSVVVQNLCWLLKFYKNNSACTNHYIICMLRRFCDDLEISPMLYQLSVLVIFYDILADQKSSRDYSNIVYFLTKFTRKMLKIIKKQPLLFVDILFWKTRKECHCINAEAVMSDLAKMKKDMRNWDGEGVNLTSEKEGLGRKSIADSLGDDEAEFVNPHDLSYHGNETILDGAHKKYPSTAKEDAAKRNTDTSFINDGIDEDKSEGSRSDFQSQTASKRPKGLVFNQEQETAIKNLYEKYKDDRRCSHLIAETLDPDGKISPLQVTCKLRKLGLKVGLRRKMVSGEVPLSVGDDLTVVKDNLISSVNDSKAQDSLFSKSTQTRKRIRAFSKEKEFEIKNLFERFKDHKKCSHMIANALDAGSPYTAAQISRKLKQLGLLVPQKKSSSKASKQSPEATGKQEHSGEETLVTIKERSKIKKSKTLTEAVTASVSQHKVTSLGNLDSDDEVLSNMLKIKRKKSKPSMKEAAATGHHYPSDDEILSTKNKVAQNQPDPVDDTIMDDEIDTKLDSSDLQDLNVTYPEDEVGELEDMLDSGDDIVPISRKTGSRRKLKMVIDVEDDDDE